ncbi:MAG: lysophospholipid acyltransferase family protein [Candidatus Sulfotelmatobacter sp.]
MTRWYKHRFHNIPAQRIIFAIIPRLPRFLHPPIALVTALIFFLMLKRERRAVAANLRQVSGKRGLALQWKVYRVFYSFCDLMVSYCYVPQATHAQLLSMLVDPERGAAKIEQALAAGNGLIVWTAHLGNWEFASRLLEMHGRPVNVARVVEDKPAEILLRNLMASERLKIVDLKAGVPATIELLQALRRNEIVAMQGDRVYQRHSAEVPFFSQPASFPLGPFLLSQVSGAPVMPGFVIRRGWLRYHAMMGDPIQLAAPQVSRVPSQNVTPQNESDDGLTDRDAGLRQALSQAVEFLEKTLTTHYDQWMNFFDFWPAASRD